MQAQMLKELKTVIRWLSKPSATQGNGVNFLKRSEGPEWPAGRTCDAEFEFRRGKCVRGAIFATASFKIKHRNLTEEASSV